MLTTQVQRLSPLMKFSVLLFRDMQVCGCKLLDQILDLVFIDSTDVERLRPFLLPVLSSVINTFEASAAALRPADAAAPREVQAGDHDDGLKALAGIITRLTVEVGPPHMPLSLEDASLPSGRS